MRTSECPCPCGNGRVYIDSYSDDWNRFEDRGPYIDCAKCSETYQIESFSFMAKSDGTMASTHYCVGKGYPKYAEQPNHELESADPFTRYLISQYSKETLTKVAEILLNSSTYNKIENKGYGASAREIVRKYKSRYNTQRLKIILESINDAISKYDTLSVIITTRKAEYEAYVANKKNASYRLHL